MLSGPATGTAKIRRERAVCRKVSPDRS
ncbi:hypothetical protein BURKHO8Y_60189 [Burkholderia sp. 8Y]|nr:hypothetical protein BURKHO8Y_60189 [Burkholderia sp. 8Y]